MDKILVSIEEYNDSMDRFMTTPRFKSTPIKDQFALLLDEANKYEIYEKVGKSDKGRQRK